LTKNNVKITLIL